MVAGISPAMMRLKIVGSAMVAPFGRERRKGGWAEKAERPLALTAIRHSAFPPLPPFAKCLVNVRADVRVAGGEDRAGRDAREIEVLDAAGGEEADDLVLRVQPPLIAQFLRRDDGRRRLRPRPDAGRRRDL